MHDCYVTERLIDLGVPNDDVWQDTVLAQAPEVAKYARKAGRTIPVAVLERL